MIRRRDLHFHGLLLLLCLYPLQGHGQMPDFRPLLTGHRVVCAQYADGLVYAGLMDGGLAIWDPLVEQTQRILTRRDGLGGHRVRDIAWIGGRLWFATLDGGLTVISHPGMAGESMRLYSSLLSSLEVTAVAGQVIGGSERIYYGTDGHGIGVITGGIPGAYYTTLDGLINDTVVDLAVVGSLLLVATPEGLSRFSENVFTNYPYDDPPSDMVNDLEIGPDGAIWAATNSGVKRWDDETRSMQPVFGSALFRALAVDGETIWAATPTRVCAPQCSSAASRIVTPATITSARPGPISGISPRAARSSCARRSRSCAIVAREKLESATSSRW